jgi:hypothetical protein
LRRDERGRRAWLALLELVYRGKGGECCLAYVFGGMGGGDGEVEARRERVGQRLRSRESYGFQEALVCSVLAALSSFAAGGGG